jgi:hypothetical protein
LKAADETGMAQSSNAGLDSEWHLLLIACSSVPANERSNRIRALAQAPIRWDALFQLAEQHGVTCLLYQALGEVRDAVPPDEARDLSQRYDANLHRVLLTAREMFRVLECLDLLAIETVPYKGLALAEMLYGDVAARQFGDIDLLIHSGDLTRIKEAVAALGYKAHLELSGKEEQAYLVSGYECAFDSAAGKNLLEVQWALQPRFYAVDFDLEGVFQRAVSVTVAGRETKTPSPEDLVLVLSVHAAKHLWTRLIWLCDIARLMQMPSLNWKWVEDQARVLGIVRIVRVTFLLAHFLLQAPIPDAIEDAITNDRESQSWAQSIVKQMVSGAAVDIESWKYFRAMMRLRERRRDQIRFLWRLALTPGPSEWNSVRLPASLFPLYRLVRLSRLAARLVHTK